MFFVAGDLVQVVFNYMIYFTVTSLALLHKCHNEATAKNITHVSEKHTYGG